MRLCKHCVPLIPTIMHTGRIDWFLDRFLPMYLIMLLILVVTLICDGTYSFSLSFSLQSLDCLSSKSA